jgi:hypothetical protein
MSSKKTTNTSKTAASSQSSPIGKFTNGAKNNALSALMSQDVSVHSPVAATGRAGPSSKRALEAIFYVAVPAVLKAFFTKLMSLNSASAESIEIDYNPEDSMYVGATMIDAYNAHKFLTKNGTVVQDQLCSSCGDYRLHTTGTMRAICDSQPEVSLLSFHFPLYSSLCDFLIHH